MRRALLAVVSALAAACGPAPEGIPAAIKAVLVTDETVQVTHAISPQTNLSPANPNALKKLLADGWGETKKGPAEKIAGWTLDGGAAPARGPSPKLLTRFVHLADTQLADDEGASRLTLFDTMGMTSGAFRPQEAWGCRLLNAAVRTINRLHKDLPIEFVLLGGDNADNAQSNEVEWFLQVLDGAPKVKCDSGAANDPVAGPDNDPKDAFAAEGLKMPWRWVTGNHDLLNQGNFVIDASDYDGYVGTDAPGGTRDWSMTDLPTTTGPVIGDVKRAPVSRSSLLTQVSASGDGHGISAEVKARGKAFYTVETASAAVRILVLDTVAETGGAEGVMHRADLDAYVRPALEKAERDGVYTILTSHHPPRTFTDGTSFGGTKQADAVTPDEWRKFLAGFPHVLAHLGAHTHQFDLRSVSTDAGHPYFEVETDSLMDWPQQVRMIEVWDGDNGQLLIRAIPLDYAVDSDAVAAEGRRRAAADFTSGWVDSNGPGPANQRAVELWLPKVAK